MGDGVLAYFGYPQAHEDDAERAVRAGLAVVDAVRALNLSQPLAVRLGIASGLAVVGDLIGEGAAQEREVVGETPNLAARLQAIATPNRVVVSDGTRRQLGGLFEVDDLGPRALPGFAEAPRAWQVVGESGVVSRFEALRTTATPLVGRDEELDLLLRRWRQAMAGEGRVVLISGEPGIGKSRLTAALAESIAGEPHTRLRYFASPHHQDSALYPFIVQLERAAGFTRDDTPEAKLGKLEALVAGDAAGPDEITLIAELLSLPNAAAELDLSPQRKREKLLAALLHQLEALARSHPVLMVFEDAHWIDPTSRDLIDLTVGRIRRLPVLLLVTFRPEFQPPWTDQPDVTTMVLNRLGERHGSALVEQLAGDAGVSSEIVAEIVERSDGVPLFIEELTKAVVEAGADRGALTLSGMPASALAVPATLHASLLGRLDRLGPTAKLVAQAGAAIGREFSYDLVAAAAELAEPELRAALRRLVESGLVYQRGMPPAAEYLFKHALVQDTAYSTLLRGPRQAAHRRIAMALEAQFPSLIEARPELAAHHYGKAAMAEKAAGLWGKAGQRSLARSALVEAAAQLTRALDQFATLPGTPALRREQMKLQVALMSSLMHVKGSAAAETKAAAEQARLLIEQAEALGEPPEDPLLLYSVLYAFWVANYVAFNGDVCRDLAAQFLTLAEKQRATVLLMVGHRMMGMSLQFTGDIAEGRGHYDTAIALYDPDASRPLATRFGHDLGVVILAYRSFAFWLLGFPEAALRDADDALRNAREIGHAATLMLALFHTSLSYTLCANHAAAAAQAQELVALAEDKGSLFWQAYGMVRESCVLALTGRASDATELLISGIAACRTTGATLWMPFHLLHLARAHAELGHFEEAWRCIGEAMTAAETTKETWCEAEIHRTAGEIALMVPESDAAKAEAHFERAIAIARAQKAKSWELRAATILARLWRDHGKRQQARDLLAPVYGWFTEGFDTADLKEAKALLDELA
jgi:predicted ATPase